MVLTVHRWFANKSCPGDWLYARLGALAAKVTAALGSVQASGLQASSLKNLSEAEAVAKIGPLFTEKQKEKAGQKPSINQILAAMQKAEKKKPKAAPVACNQTVSKPIPAQQQNEMDDFSDLATQVWQECRPAEEMPSRSWRKGMMTCPKPE